MADDIAVLAVDLPSGRSQLPAAAVTQAHVPALELERFDVVILGGKRDGDLLLSVPV